MRSLWYGNVLNRRFIRSLSSYTALMYAFVPLKCEKRQTRTTRPQLWKQHYCERGKGRGYECSPLCLTVAVAAKRALQDAIQCHQAHVSKQLKDLTGVCKTFPFILATIGERQMWLCRIWKNTPTQSLNLTGFVTKYVTLTSCWSNHQHLNCYSVIMNIKLRRVYFSIYIPTWF